MILHLNPQTFYPFGTIFPERRGNPAPGNKHALRQIIHLSQEEAPVFRSESICWVLPNTDITVLRVSTDSGRSYSNFYLDKPVSIHAGITFSLSPFQGQSRAELIGTSLPEIIEYQSQENDLRTLSSLRVESLYTLFYQEKEQGFFFPGEAHSMMELTYVDQGTLHSVADGQDLLLAQGEIVLYDSNQWHMQYADIGVAPRFLTISFDVSGLIPGQLINRKLQAPQKVIDCLHQMLQEQESPDPYTGDILLALLSQVLILLLRSLEAAPEKLQPRHSVHNENQIIRQAQQYICSHVRSKLSVPQVAAQVDVSSSYLTTLFHKHLQIAPGEYIRRIRLQESKQMIRENTMNFTQIAAALHYSTVHHFSRQFKEKFGITPSEYAKSVR